MTDLHPVMITILTGTIDGIEIKDQGTETVKLLFHNKGKCEITKLNNVLYSLKLRLNLMYTQKPKHYDHLSVMS